MQFKGKVFNAEKKVSVFRDKETGKEEQREVWFVVLLDDSLREVVSVTYYHEIKLPKVGDVFETARVRRYEYSKGLATALVEE